MAEHSPIEIIQSLARQRSMSTGTDSRGAQSPLLLLHMLDAHTGERISHLPISQRLSQAWVTLTGAPFRPHQALALSALRRGEPFALAGASTAARQTLHLLLYESLRAQPHRRALLLLPDDDLADLHLTEIRRLATVVPEALTVTYVGTETPARESAQARIILTTPDVLHRRLLRYHDRAWQAFWNNLGYIILADVDQYEAVAAAQLAGLLLRSMRLVMTEEAPLLIATLKPVQQSDKALFSLSGVTWRIIAVDDTPHPAATLVAWQSGHDYLEDAAYMARLFQRVGNRVHIICEELEIPILLRLLNEQCAQISVGTQARPAQVHILASYPGSYATVHQSLTGGPHLTILLLGNTPIERTLARLPDSLISDPAPIWTSAPLNAYISAQHLLCAAAERPLSLAEVTAWQAEDMITRLERHQHIVRLPDKQAAWQPLPSAGDPYDGFGIRSVGSSPIAIYDTQSILLDTLDPSGFDRWGFTDAALPPLRGGYRVVERDDEAGSLVVQVDMDHRRTFPLRNCTINMRQHDEHESCTLRGRVIGWGRVLIEEEIYGYRETRPGSSPVEQTLTPPLVMHWTAPAFWIDLPLRLKASGQLIGWSLVAALPLRVLCRITDLVPAYDAGLRRLYLVDAQPGGNGLSSWLYTNLDIMLPLAYDIALDCHNDALLEPAARMDMDWLLTLLSESGGAVRRRTESREPKRESQPDDHADRKQRVEAGVEDSRPVEDGRLQTTSEKARNEESVQQVRSRKQKRESKTAAAEDRVLQRESNVSRGDTLSEDNQEHHPTLNRSAQTLPAVPDPQAVHSDLRDGTGKTQTTGKGKRSRRTKQVQSPSPEEQGQSPTIAGEEQNPGQATLPTSDTRPTPPDHLLPAPPPRLAPPDAASILTRLRGLLGKTPPSQDDHQVTDAAASGAQPQLEHRFQLGDHIICLPYGEGVVRASYIQDNQEVLSVEFPEHGELEINPSISMVRRLESTSTKERQMGED